MTTTVAKATKETHEAKWCETALQVQDACNMSGVVHSFAKIMGEMCEAGLDTDARNQHPVSKLFIAKLCSLAGYDTLIPEFLNAYFAASDYCRDVIQNAKLRNANADADGEQHEQAMIDAANNYVSM